MNEEMRAEVHFHSKETATCTLACSWQGMDAVRAELLMFSCFANRQIANLGPEYAPRVGVMLLPLKQPLFTGAVIYTSTGTKEATLGIEESPQLLQAHPGPASMRFVAKLTDNTFKMSIQGFGFFGTKLLYFAPMSIVMLLQHMAGRRLADEKYIAALEGIVQRIGNLASSGLINVKSQKTLAFETALGAMIWCGLMED